MKSMKSSCTLAFTGTVRRFLENHGNSLEAVVFAVSETEEVCKISVSVKCLHVMYFQRNICVKLKLRLKEKNPTQISSKNLSTDSKNETSRKLESDRHKRKEVKLIPVCVFVAGL